MPIITVDSDDLKSLIGRKISDEEMKKVLPLNKLSIEDWSEEIKIEVTPDRPDLFSTEGMARQISSWLGINTGLVKTDVSKPLIEVVPSKVSLRPFITCGVVRGVRMNDSMIKSIMQLQEMLDFTLGRDRKKVAIGLHDVCKVIPPFYYKEILPEEIEFVPLNSSKRMNLMQVIKTHPKGIQYSHLVRGAKKWPVIVDSKNRVLSFPPIINGELTKVTEETTDLFIDITGPNERLINHCLNILVTALEKRGGKIEAVSLGGKLRPDLSPRLMEVNTDEARKLLGLEISNKEIQTLLERMGYGAAVKKNSASVLIPAFRADILHPVDIIEDIGIAYGFYDIIPEVPRLPTTGEANRTEELSNRVRELMIGLGFQEVINYTLTSKERQFAKMNVKPESSVEIENPVSQEYSACRRWLLPSLIENIRSNKHRKFPQKIFEIADCIIPNSKSDTSALNVRKLSGVTAHSHASLSEIISILNAIKENFGVKWEMKSYKHESFIPGRCGAIFLPGMQEPLGIFGEINPKVLVNFELNNPAAAFELDAEKIFEH
ncbi:MAG: phenylalanine--tRNA ligase subunit beta [Candidatus Aenigmarchaeota archaeon]|nr:phenylalanine--tRNA ligase subunit beta [Candidatus Aenigmarchaeota archaeon]